MRFFYEEKITVVTVYGGKIGSPGATNTYPDEVPTPRVTPNSRIQGSRYWEIELIFVNTP